MTKETRRDGAREKAVDKLEVLLREWERNEILDIGEWKECAEAVLDTCLDEYAKATRCDR